MILMSFKYITNFIPFCEPTRMILHNTNLFTFSQIKCLAQTQVIVMVRKSIFASLFETPFYPSSRHKMQKQNCAIIQKKCTHVYLYTRG